jgi:hypothetical protein
MKPYEPYRFSIDEDTGVDFCDAGVWRSYQVSGYGDTASELYQSLTISEVDQDGGELDTYNLAEAREDVIEAAMHIFTRALLGALQDRKPLLNPETSRLSIQVQFKLTSAQPKDLYEALNVLFKLGYGPLSEADINATKLYLDKLKFKAGL